MLRRKVHCRSCWCTAGSAVADVVLGVTPFGAVEAVCRGIVGFLSAHDL